jgi:hypothetical protein
MLFQLLTAIASAGPAPVPPPAPVIEVVPQFHEGQVHLFLAGRDGDKVFIDDFPFGVLPLTTQLAEGPHTFRVEGAQGKYVVDREVKVVEGVVSELDLAPLPPPPPAPGPAPAAPAPAPAPAKP